MAKQINFSWAHFIALGLLTRDEERVTERELKEKMPPEINNAILDFVNKGFARWDNSLGTSVQGYYLTAEGRAYIEELKEYASKNISIAIEEIE